MADAPKWPPYPTGPIDSIFAVGVATIKYSEIEASLVFIFANVLGIPHKLATMIHSRVSSDACIKLIIQILPPKPAYGPELQAVSEVRYFLEAFQICTENRNHLVHSTIAPMGTPDTVLYKTSKQGNVILSMPDGQDLRQIADDMHTYHLYGRNLGNAIAAHSTKQPIFPFPWPDRPQLPRSLDYTSDPLPLRSTRQGGPRQP